MSITKCGTYVAERAMLIPPNMLVLADEVIE
jgi:hypothetical protein